MRTTYKILFVFISIFLAGQFIFVQAAKAEGASLFISPSTASYQVNSEFSVTIRVNTDTQAINAAEAGMHFDSSKLEVQSLSIDNSIFNFWVPKRPAFDNAAGNITFSGGLPRPGFTGKDGALLAVNFKAKAPGDAQLIFTSGAILANDDKGTNILTSMGSASYKIIPQSMPPKAEQPKDNADAQEKKKEEREALPEQPSPAKNEQTPVQAAEAKIISLSHPDQNCWYASNTVNLSWPLPEDAEGVSFIFNNNINAEPPQKTEGRLTSKTYTGVGDGVWYFQLKIKEKSGWSDKYTFRVQIDTTPPEPIEAQVEQADLENWPMLLFKTVDKASGILRYEIKIGSLEEKAYVIKPEEASLLAEGLEPGEHTALIKAIDKAGNEAVKEIKFIILPIDTPTLEYFSNEVRSADKPFFSGKTIKEGNITLYIQNEDSTKVMAKTARSDGSGNWFILSDNMPDGRYTAWIEASNKNGLRSKPSSRVSFLVSPPVFAKLGSLIINYFTVFASLLFMLILIVFASVFLFSFARKKLKKETFEIENAVNQKLEELKQDISSELAQLAKATQPGAYESERAKIRTRLHGKIETAGKKIIKEVKDVEDILK